MRAEPTDTTVVVTLTRADLGGAAAAGEGLGRYLVVVEDDEVVASALLGAEAVTVGRDANCHVALDDEQVSRLHLKIFVAGDQVIAEDLGSSNGTFLDRQRVSGTVVLEEGRWLQVGSHLLKQERCRPSEVARADELRRDLRRARSYVRSLLPAPLATGPVRTDWFYRPSTHLGGDAFGYDWLDEGRLAAYLLDVSGHGVFAAMHSVSVLNVLRQRALPGTDFRDPAQVLDRLNAMFPMEDHDGMYFTMWYGVYSLPDRQLSFASAGHHPGFLFAPGEPRRPLKSPGPMIGAMPKFRYSSNAVTAAPGAALYLFSDGAFEVTAPDGCQRGLDDFLPLLEGAGAVASGESERIYQAVRAGAKPGPLDDDYSFLVLRFD